MRPRLAAATCCLVLALALAGCNSVPDAPTDGNTGTTPPGYQTNPPTSSYSQSITTTGTSNTTTTAATTTSTYPGPRFDGQHDERSASDPDFPGLGASGQLNGGGDRLTVEASAFNYGERTYRVRNVCAGPWSEDLSGPSGPAAMRQPGADCTGFGLRDFAPGESIPYTGAWDGTLWQDGAYVAAPPGTYTWALTFTVYAGGSGAAYDDMAQMRLPFSVTVR